MMKMSLATRLTLAFFCLLPFASLFAQSTSSEEAVQNYIERFKYVAIREMKVYGIPASITLAQGILESNAGRSELAVRANNHFGIKCHKEWTGPTYHQDDDKPNECFRKYDDPLDSYRDHSLFLTTRERYKALFSLKPNDYKGWAQGLKSAGYATNPDYANLLIRNIEKYSLHQYDRGDAVVEPLPPAEPKVKEQAGRPVRYSYFAPGPGGRKTYTNNHTWFVFVARGEGLADIAKAFGIPLKKLIRYNDLETGQPVVEGDPVYLAKKQRKGAQGAHKVEEGQTLWEISQIYAVRLSKLCARNGMEPGTPPEAGTVLSLR